MSDNLEILLSEAKTYINTNLSADGKIYDCTWQCTGLSKHNDTSIGVGFRMGAFEDLHSKALHVNVDVGEIDLTDINGWLHSLESLDKFIQISDCPYVGSDLLFAIANAVQYEIRGLSLDDNLAEEASRLVICLDLLAIEARNKALKKKKQMIFKIEYYRHR